MKYRLDGDVVQFMTKLKMQRFFFNKEKKRSTSMPFVLICGLINYSITNEYIIHFYIPNNDILYTFPVYLSEDYINREVYVLN